MSNTMDVNKVNAGRGRMSRPIRGNRIDKFDLAYVQARMRSSIFNLMHMAVTDIDPNSADSFHAKCKEIAKMTGRRTDQITRYLVNPGYVKSLDVIADIMWALDGATLDPKVKRPLNTPKALSHD